MTLLLHCGTNDNIFVASDRVLCRLDKKLTVVDRDSCKSLILNKYFIVSYAGIAFINGENTLSWVASISREHNDIASCLVDISERATIYFEKKRQSYNNLTVTAFGWDIGRENTVPVLCFATSDHQTVKNLSTIDRGLFKLGCVKHPRGNKIMIKPFGFPLNNTEKILLRREMKNTFEKHKCSEKSIPRFLVEIIRRKAAKTHAVSKNVLVTYLNRYAAIESTIKLFPFINNRYGGLYYSEADEGSVMYSPAYVETNLIVGPGEFHLGRSLEEIASYKKNRKK